MPTTTYTKPELSDLTSGTVSGTGVFDVMMKTIKAHLDEEFAKNRIKGPEYSQVYLGALTAVLDQSQRFLLDKDKSFYEAQLVEAQIRLAEANILLVEKQIEKELLGLELVEAQAAKVRRETLLLDTQEDQVIAQTALVNQQTANALTENTTMQLQQSLLNGQIALAGAQKISTDAQSALVIQKTITEKAQVSPTGVDLDSVIGKQKCLYQAQTDGFQRDAEQRAAKLMVDTWNVRRTTDEGTVADGTNKLNDATIGAAITKLLAGVGVVA